VSIINTATNTVVNTVTVGFRPLAVAVTPNGKYAYVTNLKRFAYYSDTGAAW